MGTFDNSPVQKISFVKSKKLEIDSVKNVINEIDGAAFIMIHPLADAAGGKIKKTDLH